MTGSPYAIENLYDTAANWTATNPVLKRGQLGIEAPSTPSGSPKQKCGDGVTGWNTLGYFATGSGGGGGGDSGAGQFVAMGGGGRVDDAVTDWTTKVGTNTLGAVVTSAGVTIPPGLYSITFFEFLVVTSPAGFPISLGNTQATLLWELDSSSGGVEASALGLLVPNVAADFIATVNPILNVESGLVIPDPTYSPGAGFIEVDTAPLDGSAASYSFDTDHPGAVTGGYWEMIATKL